MRAVGRRRGTEVALPAALRTLAPRCILKANPVSFRLHHPDPTPSGGDSQPQQGVNRSGESARSGRLSLMLTYGGWRDGDFADQLPALLGPLGIDCHRCRSGLEATEFIVHAPVHIAIVDLSIQMESGASRPTPAGSRVLQLLRRLEQPPPTVVVRPPQPCFRDSARGLSDALRDGAFAVIDGPVRLESMLEVLRRVVRRHYRDHWPAA